jgi:hypothetical protein
VYWTNITPLSGIYRTQAIGKRVNFLFHQKSVQIKDRICFDEGEPAWTDGPQMNEGMDG